MVLRLNPPTRPSPALETAEKVAVGAAIGVQRGETVVAPGERCHVARAGTPPSVRTPPASLCHLHAGRALPPPRPGGPRLRPLQLSLRGEGRMGGKRWSIRSAGRWCDA